MRLLHCLPLAILALTGCRSALGPTPTPDNLDARLAAIEHTRLADIHASSRHTKNAAGSSAYTPVLAVNRPAALPAPIANTLTPTANEQWTLSAFQDELPDEDDPHADITFASRDVAGEDPYVRRPPLDSFWETLKRDVKYMPEDLWRDTKRVYANPVHLVILGTAYGGSIALQETGPDDTVEDHFRDGHHHLSKDWREAFAAAGNPGTHFGLAGLWYLVGQQTHNEKTYEVGKTMFSALIINGVTVLCGQAATWDRSPNGELGTFPSGHTSSSFVMASVLHRAYGHLVGIPLYGVATLVAMERVEDGEHYFSDVAMGAALGTLIGHSVASGRDPEVFGWKVVPYVTPGSSTGIALMKTMK